MVSEHANMGSDPGSSPGQMKAASGGPAAAATSTNTFVAAVIDRQGLLSHCMDNREFALALLAEMQSASRKQVTQIRSHITNNLVQAAAEAAHTLKGAAATVAAEPLRQLAAEIEQACRTGNLSHARTLLGKLTDELARCQVAIDRLMCELRSAESTCESTL